MFTPVQPEGFGIVRRLEMDGEKKKKKNDLWLKRGEMQVEDWKGKKEKKKRQKLLHGCLMKMKTFVWI